MKIKLLMLGVASASLLISCKKKNKEECLTQNNQTYDSYMPLKDGNYWIYESKTLDTLGNIISTANKNDTITIIGDTIIESNTYKKIKKTSNNLPFSIPDFIREKDGELLTFDENIEKPIFSIFKDTLIPIKCIEAAWSQNCDYELGRVMLQNTETINVTAGTFEVENAQDIIIKNNNGAIGWSFWGKTRYNDNQFAKNIGLIRSEIFFISTTDVVIKELVSYHLN